MKSDYVIFLVIAAAGIALGLFALREGNKYQARRRTSVKDLKGLVRKPSVPVSIEDMKIQSTRSLREEMFAVARGERKAPSDAGNISFESVEAANSWGGITCPVCGVAKLVRGTRDMPYTHKGHSTVIRSLIGDFCPACTELILDLDETRRAMKLMREFENKVDGK